MKNKLFLVLIIFVFIFCSTKSHFVFAENNSKDKEETVTIKKAQLETLTKKMETMESQLRKLKAELEEFKDKQKKEASGNVDDLDAELKTLQQELGGEADTGESAATVARQTQSMNPKISVVGDFTWQINHDKNIDGGNAFNLRELELGFEDNVDPWSKAAFYVGMHSHNGDIAIHVEEAYLDFHRMPLGTQLKLGKYFLPFGKDNQLHQHARPYVDMPLVNRNFLSSESLGGTGAQVSYMIPLGKVFSEIQGYAVKDEGNRSFSGGDSGKPLYGGRARVFGDISEASNIELGYSHLRGFNNAAATRLTKLNGIDITYRWKPLKRSHYNSFLLRGEYLHSNRAEANRVIKNMGYYGLAQYQLNKNWYLGARYDYSEFPGLINSHEKGYSGILTYLPTEFAYYRLQYNHLAGNYKPHRNELWFQINFMMGPHGVHEF
ncbi:MAG: hypothetical protein ACLFQV_11705 [Vulcanimicrobiota bacterium]